MNKIKLLSQILRHKYIFSAVIFSILAIGTFVIQMLPEIYAVNSRLGISGGDLNWENTNGGIVTQSNRLARKFYATRDHLMSTSQIKEMLTKFGLISEDMDDEEILNEVKSFIQSTNLEMVEGEVINPYSGKEGKMETGVKIVYENISPELAYKITDELTQRFLTISETTSSTIGKEKVNYLKKQLDLVGQQILEIDEEIASYKNEHALSSPELHPVLLSRYNELQLKIDQSNKLLSDLKRRESEIRADLATTNNQAFLYAADGSRVLGIDERLTILKLEYADKSSRYSPSHPDIKKLKQEIEVLEKSQNGYDTAGIEVELAETTKKLKQLQAQYKNNHPDIAWLKSKQKKLQDTLALARTSNNRLPSSRPSNPLYARTLTRLESVQDEYRETLIDKERLIKEHKEIENQIGVIPLVQKTLLQFERAKEQAESKYAELESAFLQAELTNSLSDTNLSERFELIQPPQYPLHPVKPRKDILRLVLLLLAAAGGLAAVLLLDVLNDRIWGKADLKQCVDGPIYHIPELN